MQHMRLLGAALLAATACGQVDGTFTYQGELREAGMPAAGQYDIRFVAFDAPAAGTVVGVACVSGVTVAAGRFTVEINFPEGVFSGDERYLEISVRSAAGPCDSGGGYTTLSQRQRFAPAPYAMFATRAGDASALGGQPASFYSNAANLTGVLPGASLSGTYGGAISFSNPANSITGNGASLTNLNASNLSSGSVPGARLNGAYSNALTLNNASNIFSGTFTGPHFGAGAGLTSLNASNLSQGTVSNARTTGTSFSSPNTLVLRDASGNFAASAVTAVSLSASSAQVSDEIVLPAGTIRRGGSTPATEDLGLYSLNSNAWLRLVSNNAPIQFYTNSTQGTANNPTPDSQVMTIHPNGNVGIGTGNPTVKLQVAGRVKCREVEIDSGADIVEGFASSAGVLEPGTVVVIDADNPGALKVSDGAYDTRVAGVVSGANGLKHGLKLGTDEFDGDARIAMVGRVYVKCSTQNGAIRPGDRLTTASLPGHAMRATDAARADGAVIGKAMTSLNSGEGLVLVLVNLQ